MASFQGSLCPDRVLLNDSPDIVISTPTRLLQLIRSSTVALQSLSFLAIDEADLLLSYGHKDDLAQIVDPANGWIPRLGVQGCLMSATLSEDVDVVKGLVLRNPVSSIVCGTCWHLTSCAGHSHTERSLCQLPSQSILHIHFRT